MPNSFQIKMGLAIVGYPAIAASLGMLLARITRADSGARQAALAAAATAGLVTSHLALAGLPKLPPVDSIGWVPIATLAAGVIGIVLALAARSSQARRWAVAIGLAAAAAAAAYLAGKPTFSSSLGRFAPIGAGAAAVTFVAVAASSRVAHRGFAVGSWLAMLVVAALSALCALWGSSASLATLLGSMATTAGVLGIGGLVLRIPEPAPAAQGVFIAHVTATLTYAHLYASLPTAPTVLLVAALVAPTLGALVPGEGVRSRWVRAAVSVVLAVAVAGAAALIMHDKAAQSGESSV